MMQHAIHPRLASWHADWPEPLTTGSAGMAQAGLFHIGLTETLDDGTLGYAAIAAMKDALVEATGLLGLAGMWAGRQLVARFFLLGFGTEAQRVHLLPRLADGTASLAVAISEPGVGAHPKQLTTRASADGADMILSGAKAWVSNALEATHLIVFAIVEESAGRKRYSAFLLPTDAAGLRIEPMPGFDALPPSRHCAVWLDGCRVPASARLGPHGTAFEAMAVPFRDVEDAVAAAGLAGAFRAVLRGLAPLATEEKDAQLGAIAGLVAVLDHTARAVVAALDAGRLRREAAANVGLRVLATEIRARLAALIGQIAPPPDPARDRLLADLDALLGIARGPRAVRQARLGAALRLSP